MNKCIVGFLFVVSSAEYLLTHYLLLLPLKKKQEYFEPEEHEIHMICIQRPTIQNHSVNCSFQIFKHRYNFSVRTDTRTTIFFVRFYNNHIDFRVIIIKFFNKYLQQFWNTKLTSKHAPIAVQLILTQNFLLYYIETHTEPK